jgi:zinc transport system substrate-binding protein
MHRFLILLLILGLVSCGTVSKKPQGPFIAVSVLPQKYLVKGIADTLAEVHVIIPPGASPATWEPSTSDMKDLGDALIYFRIGHIGFEQAWISDIMDLNPGLTVVDLSGNITLRGINYAHGDHRHHGVDPHTWMSAENMEIMARSIFVELQKIFPEHKAQLRNNYSDLMLEIKKSRQFAEEQLAEHKGRSFLVFHPSLGYLADDFELNQISIEFEGKEPSPSYLKELIDQTDSLRIKSIFVQEEFDMTNAEVIAREIDGKVIKIKPLSENWPEEYKKIVMSLKHSFE